MGHPRHNHQVIEADAGGRPAIAGKSRFVFVADPASVALGLSLRMSASQANRAISTGKLHALLRFHTRPINVVVYHGSQGRTSFEAGFPLRCFQRLSFPYLATRQCSWRHNRSTRGTSTPVLSY